MVGRRGRGEGYVFKLVDIPGVVLVRPMTGEVGGGDVCDDFSLDADDLCRISF